MRENTGMVVCGIFAVLDARQHVDMFDDCVDRISDTSQVLRVGIVKFNEKLKRFDHNFANASLIVSNKHFPQKSGWSG